jgi:hypothetical protein
MRSHLGVGCATQEREGNVSFVFMIEGTCSKSTREVSKMGGNETDHVLVVRLMNGTF